MNGAQNIEWKVSRRDEDLRWICGFANVEGIHMTERGAGHAIAPVLPLAKAEGAFLALAAGDALGWPQEMSRKVRGSTDETAPHVEFRTWTRRSGGRFQPYEEVIRPGEYSDDTQLTLAVARSRTDYGSDWWKAFAKVELPLWTIYERGGGGATKRAARAWIGGCPPWKSRRNDAIDQYFQAGGNGVAMRVLPHAIFLSDQEDPAALVHDVVLDGSATHGHPRALVGATAYAYAAWSLARRSRILGFGQLLELLLDESSGWGAFPELGRGGGTWLAAANRAAGDYMRIWERTVGEMRQLLETAQRGIRAGALVDDRAALNDLGCFGRSKGAGTVSAAAAYLTARHAAHPPQGVLRAAFESGADTDTIAAMTGGLMGCLAGIEWLPGPWLQVQDAEYLRSMARRIAMGPEGADQHPVEPVRDPKSLLSDFARNGDCEVALGGSRRVRATALTSLKPIAKSISVRGWRLRASEGQTMYVTIVDRLTGTRAASRASGKPEPTRPASSGAADAARMADPGPNPKDALYIEFCRQARSILESGAMKRTEIEKALDLVPSQVGKWLERAEQEEKIQRVSGKPAKFALSRKALL